MPDPRSHDRFVELLTQYRGPLFGYIYALVRRLDDAEDLYQDTAMVMWSKFQEYEPGTNFMGWACTVARFRVANFLKGERRRRRYFGPRCRRSWRPFRPTSSPRRPDGSKRPCWIA